MRKKSSIALVILVSIFMLCVAVFYAVSNISRHHRGNQSVNLEQQPETVRYNQQSDLVQIEYLDSYDCKNIYLYHIISPAKALALFKREHEQQYEDSEEAFSENVEEIPDIKDFIDQNDKSTIIDIIKGNDTSVQRIYLPEDDSYNRGNVDSASAHLNVEFLSQKPELPTGCEITSLTTVLNYLGYDVSKETMANEYLPKCDISEVSFWDYFLGDPSTEY